MKKILSFVIIFIFSFAVHAQEKEITKKEIVDIIEAYTQNFDKPEYGDEFVKTKLNPALLELEKRTCEKIGTRLFERFIIMIIKTQGKMNETIPQVLGGIFICKTELVEDFLTKKYRNGYLKNILEFGYNLRIQTMKEKPKNLYPLNKRLKQLLKKI